MTEEEEFLEETAESSSGASSLNINAIKATIELSDLWKQYVEGKISDEEFKELKEQIQEQVVTEKRRRRRR